MACQGGQTSVELRKLIISYYQEGKSFREIGKIVHRSHSSVQNIIGRFRQEHRIANKAKRSPRKIFNESDERWLRLQIEKNPMLSAPKLVKEAEINLTKKACAETVRRVLRKDNFLSQVARNRPFISNKNESLEYIEHSDTLFTTNIQDDLKISNQIKTEPQDVENEMKTDTGECDEASATNVEHIDIKPSLHFLATTDIKSELEDTKKSFDNFQDVDKPQDEQKIAGELIMYKNSSLNDITPLNETCTEDDNHIKCKICGKSFGKAILATHMHLHAEEASIMCGLCNKSFVDQHEFDRHLRSHPGEKPRKYYSCYLCNKLFVYKSVYDIHFRAHSRDKPFQCDRCPNTFSYKSGLTRHKLMHTGEKPFTCDFCGKSFSRKHNLMEHTTIHSEEKPFTCDSCTKTFSNKSKLIEHIRVHTGEKPFMCEHCNKSYKRKSHLDDHVQTHSDNKHFSCNICSKQFYKKSLLNAHMQIHNGKKCFTCNICNLSFSKKSNLNSHMHIHKVL